MMRSYGLLGLVVVGFVSICAITVRASPKKYEYHPVGCQIQNVVSGAGGSSGTPHIQVDNMAIWARGGALAVICPMDHITFTDDPGAAAYVTITAKVTTPATGTSSCEFDSESDTQGWLSLPASSFPAANTAGTITHGANMIFPSMSSTGPFGMQLACTLAKDLKLGSIEVEVD